MSETPNVLTGAVAFTDIAGFTEFTALRGDHEALALLSKQEAIVNAELTPGARLIKEIGDGLLFWFPSASDAIDTMVRLQERFEEASFDPETPLWVRMGVHWGTQMQRRDDIVGHDVNLASRICNLAAPGEILISGAAARAAAGLPGILLEEVGPAVLKGIPEPVALYRATRAFAPALALAPGPLRLAVLV